MESSPEIAAQRALAREIGPNEQLLWSGMPKQGLVLRTSDLLVIPLGIGWAGFLVFWHYGMAQTGGPLLTFGSVVSTAIGLYVLVGRFIWDSWERKKLYYALTDQRALIYGGLLDRKLRSVNYHALPEIVVEDSADGDAPITFGTPIPALRWTGNTEDGKRSPAPPSFERIRSGRRVYEMILEQQRAARCKAH